MREKQFFFTFLLPLTLTLTLTFDLLILVLHHQITSVRGNLPEKYNTYIII